MRCYCPSSWWSTFIFLWIDLWLSSWVIAFFIAIIQINATWVWPLTYSPTSRLGFLSLHRVFVDDIQQRWTELTCCVPSHFIHFEIIEGRLRWIRIELRHGYIYIRLCSLEFVVRVAWAWWAMYRVEDILPNENLKFLFFIISRQFYYIGHSKNAKNLDANDIVEYIVY